jgi:Ca2+-binding RTX toxin-like protein
MTISLVETVIDVLIEWPRIDTLYGGTGSDTFSYNLGDGNDTNQQYDSSAGRNDVLVFGQGITHDAIWLSASGTLSTSLWISMALMAL